MIDVSYALFGPMCALSLAESAWISGKALFSDHERLVERNPYEEERF